jgi:hypothetical protein
MQNLAAELVANDQPGCNKSLQRTDDFQMQAVKAGRWDVDPEQDRQLEVSEAFTIQAGKSRGGCADSLKALLAGEWQESAGIRGKLLAISCGLSTASRAAAQLVQTGKLQQDRPRKANVRGDDGFRDLERTKSESLSLSMKLGTARFNSSGREGAARCCGAYSIGQPMKCPHCHQEIGIATTDLADHAFLLRAQCEKCGREFLIVERLPMTDEEYSSHTSP